MEKFSKKYLKSFKDLPFSYFSTPVYLEFSGYVFLRNNSPVLVWQDMYYPHDFPSLFLPVSKLNWENCSAVFVTDEDIGKIKKKKIEIKLQNPVGTEFFYSTDDFINPKDDFRRRAEQFKNEYKYVVKNNYPLKKVIKFYKFWKSQKERKADTFHESEEFFYYCINNLKKHFIKQVYVEVDKKLAGLAFGVEHPSGNWVGLQLKVDYNYKGLSRFLHHERAKLFKDKKLFTLGTGAHESGIAQYKTELGPTFQKDYFYILTGKKNGI